MIRDTEDVVALIARLRSDARGADAWRAMDEAADRLQSLSDRIDVLKEWAFEKSRVHHQLAHDNEGLRTEHIASSAAYRELALEIEARAALHQEGITP